MKKFFAPIPQILIAFGLVAASAAPQIAVAQEYAYTLSPSVTETPQLSHRAGQTIFLSMTYNAATHRFTLDMSFVPSPTTGWLPNGLYAVINNGVFPKGRQGEFAMLFFDATNAASPKLTAYAYNGNNRGDSWKIGDFGGSAPPDKILSSITDTSWIHSLKVTDSGGLRVFSIDIDTTVINQHWPKYPSLNWSGLKFDNYIGIWSHPVANMKTAYGADGFLTQRTGNDGYVDVARAPTAGCDGVVGSMKQVDSCGVCGGDGSSCGGVTPMVPPVDTPTPGVGVKCESVDTTTNLFLLDSHAAALKNLVLSISNQIKRLGSRNTSALRTVKSNDKKASDAYVKAWSTAWSLPRSIVSCTGTVTCTSADIPAFNTVFTESVENLVEIIKSSLKLLKKVNAPKSASYRRTANKKLATDILTLNAEVAQLPAAESLCQ